MKIAQKLLLIILATSLLPMVALGLPMLLTSENALRNQIQHQIDSTATHQLDRLSAANAKVNTQINDVLNKAQLRLLLDQYNNKPSAALQTEISQSLQTIVTNEDTFHELHILDSSGRTIASTDPSALGRDYSKTEVFEAGRQAISTSIFFVNPDQEIDQYLAGPLQLNGKPIGVALVEATSAPYLAIMKDYSELGLTGESYLVRKTAAGQEQYITPLRFDAQAELKTTGGTLARGVDYRKHAVLFSSHAVPDTEWTLVVKIDQSEVYASIAGLRRVVIVIIALTLLAVVLASILAARSLSAPIMSLTEKTRRIMEGDFSQKIALNAGGEIGDLAAAFNTMTDRLAESYSALEQKVAARTQELNVKLRELANAKAKDDAILGSIGDGMIVTDNAGFILLINDIAANLLGIDRAVSYGKRASEAYELYDDAGQLMPTESRPLQIALATGRKTVQIAKCVRKDGTKNALSITAAPVVQQDTIIGVIETIRDITKEKEVDRMKTEFISLASHQLRTPLSAIRWFTEMLLSGDAGKLNPDQEEFAHNVADSTQRMIELVNSLLNISRIESGRIIIDPKPTDLSELVRGIVNDLKGKTAEKQQNMVISVHKELPKINIDPRMIGQVYLNLLTNAIKYTPKGGEISVFVSRKGDEVVSQITDNGYGIPKSEQSKMFQKFFRATNVVKFETDGTGLGMYLVKSIVESSGGRIWFESTEGKGTTFWFTIPFAGMKAKAGEVTLDA